MPFLVVGGGVSGGGGCRCGLVVVGRARKNNLVIRLDQKILMFAMLF